MGRYLKRTSAKQKKIPYSIFRIYINLGTLNKKKQPKTITNFIFVGLNWSPRNI